MLGEPSLGVEKGINRWFTALCSIGTMEAQWRPLSRFLWGTKGSLRGERERVCVCGGECSLLRDNDI